MEALNLVAGKGHAHCLLPEGAGMSLLGAASPADGELHLRLRPAGLPDSLVTTYVLRPTRVEVRFGESDPLSSFILLHLGTGRPCEYASAGARGRRSKYTMSGNDVRVYVSCFARIASIRKTSLAKALEGRDVFEDLDEGSLLIGPTLGMGLSRLVARPDWSRGGSKEIAKEFDRM